MPGRDVRLTLDDGGPVTIRGEDVSRVCENLLRLAPDPNAVVLAAVVIAESRYPSQHIPLKLTAPQTAVIRKALAIAEAA